MRFITLSKSEVLNKSRHKLWLLAIDPETLEARIVQRDETGFVRDVEGHEDLFPLGMCLEREDGFLEGGDWLVASTPNKREHDGIYRSYWIKWED